jgi:hypothetical protein
MSTPVMELPSELVKRPQSIDELRARENFEAPLDHIAHALRQVLTDYDFPKEVPCGLKSCRQPHLHGYLVRTDGGKETNIGRQCGKTHFGEAVFSSARAEYVRRREREELIAKAKHLQSIAPEIEAAIRDLTDRDFGAKWARRATTALQSVIGESLVDGLRTSTIRNELSVIKPRRRSDEEIDNIMVTNRGMTRDRAMYEDEVIGQLKPASWLGFDFREKLMVNLFGPLKVFCELVPEELPSPKLKADVRRFDGYERSLRQASDCAASALRFLSDDNLQLVVLWIPDHMKGAAASLRGWIGGNDHRSLLQGAAK